MLRPGRTLLGCSWRGASCRRWRGSRGACGRRLRGRFRRRLEGRPCRAVLDEARRMGLAGGAACSSAPWLGRRKCRGRCIVCAAITAVAVAATGAATTVVVAVAAAVAATATVVAAAPVACRVQEAERAHSCQVEALQGGWACQKQGTDLRQTCGPASSSIWRAVQPQPGQRQQRQAWRDAALPVKVGGSC